MISADFTKDEFILLTKALEIADMRWSFSDNPSDFERARKISRLRDELMEHAREKHNWYYTQKEWERV